MVGSESSILILFLWLHLVLQQHALQYPILSRMAKDYLAIQGSATPSEHSFSSGALTDAKLRSQMSSSVFEGLQLLKSAYRNGHIKASERAGANEEASKNI